MKEKDVRHSISSHSSNISASATAVNPSPTSEDRPRNSASGIDIDFDFDSLSDDVLSSDSEDDEPPEPPLPEDPIQGWPQLAMAMAKTPDFAAFPRFRDLNTKSLLYYQAQLAIYRTKLHKLEYGDKAKGEIWAERADKLVETESEQFKTVREMRKVLKEYNKALLQYSKICALPEPEPYDMQTLRQWLRNKRGADSKVRGAHDLPHTWGNIRPESDQEDGSVWRQFGRMMLRLIWVPTIRDSNLDLVVTKPQVKVDGLTRWVVSDVIRFWKKLKKSRKDSNRKAEGTGDVEKTAPSTVGCFGQHRGKTKKKRAKAKKVKKRTSTPPIGHSVDKVKKEETLESWGERSALRVTSAISTVVACLLPVVAISVLSQLQGLRNLLICLAGFAIIFALGLIFLTQGTSSRTEIFGATAAFSAVMVVFISIPPAPVILMPPGAPMPSISPSPIASLLQG